MAQLPTHGTLMTEHFLGKGVIRLLGPINQITSLKFIKYTQFLASKGYKDIYCYLDSEGGDMWACYSILDQINLLEGQGIRIHIIVIGVALSAAADILVMGTLGYRFLTPGATVMMHPISYGISPDYEKFQEAWSNYIKKQTIEHNKKIAGRMGITVNKLNKLIANSFWLDAQSAIKFKLADGIWTPEMEKYVIELRDCLEEPGLSTNNGLDNK